MYMFCYSHSSLLDGRIRQRTGRGVDVGDIGIPAEIYTLGAWWTWLYWLYIYIPGYNYWIGGSDRGREGVWRWETSGSRMNYTNWHPGQPDGGNQDCLAIYSSGSVGTWWDLTCSWSNRYICESVWVWIHAVYVSYYILESVWVRKHNMCVSVRIKTYCSSR